MEVCAALPRPDRRQRFQEALHYVGYARQLYERFPSDPETANGLAGIVTALRACGILGGLVAARG